MRMLTWDYDTNTVTEWCRMGSCNHCGECCEVEITLRTSGTFGDHGRNGGDSVSGEGVWHEWENGKPHYWQVTEIDFGNPHDCFQQFLAADYEDCSSCKPAICLAWPLHPDHVECFDNCSYRFVKLNEWEIEDDSEPIKEVEEVCEIIEEKQEITE